MNGVLGPYTIKPDQMSLVNPLCILAFIPLFESVVYPGLEKYLSIKFVRENGVFYNLKY